MNYAIILAGGSGTRFWPLSRESEPKQFLKISSSRPMIEETLIRISSLVKKDNIHIAINKTHQEKINDCIRKFNIHCTNILLEPKSRNTLAPIGLLSKRIWNKDKDAVIIVLPSDHYIRDKARFIKTLKQAIEAAKKGFIVTLGIKAIHPETGYGYIKINPKTFKVQKFIEKPDLVKAKIFSKDRKYFWNAGIFIFRADILLGEIKKFMPQDFQVINQLSNKALLRKLWNKIAPVSIDYAIMEKTTKMALIPGNFGWNDLGSWKAMGQVVKKDSSGNIIRGNCLDIGSSNSIILSAGRLVATLGLKDIIVVDTKDALLVCAKEKSQDVKNIVQLLKKKNRINLI